MRLSGLSGIVSSVVRSALLPVLAVLLVPAYLFFALLVAYTARRRAKKHEFPRLFWGSVPIINNKYWSKSMCDKGLFSKTFTTDFYSTINSRSDWDLLMSEEFVGWPRRMQPYLAFLRVLLDYDVLFISFQGAFLGDTILWRLQAPLIRMAGRKTVVIPYGGDAYVYRFASDPSLTHGLLLSYPEAARRQAHIAAQVDYWCANADAMIPGFIGPDGIGRWDVLIGSQLFLDLSQWEMAGARRGADGTNGVVTICHAPNHRGFKGTEFVVAAVEALKAEGLNIELRLLEGLPNEQVRRVLCEEVDILVEQLVFTGHGMSGLEGLASGLPVVSNLENAEILRPFRRWSYFSECPIVSASPETILSTLRKLIVNPQLRSNLGRAGRQYAEKYHGLDSAAYLFGEVLEYIQGRRETLLNMYHPLSGEWNHRLPKVNHPLVDNRIPE